VERSTRNCTTCNAVLPSFVEEGDSVRGYLKGVFGGILAVLAAFGWTVTLAFVVALKFQKQDQAYGISVYAINGPALWIVLFLIFAVGFYLGFRKVY
jgi:hypothetical protein